MAASAGLRLVEKTVEVLDCLCEQRELTAGQLAKITGEPRSSLYRLLASMERLGLVEPGIARGSYRLGLHVLRLGVATQESLSVRELSLPVLNSLMDETGLTAYLVVERDLHGVCIERVEGRGVASLALRVGGSMPLHVGAAPRSLLAFEPEEAWRAYAEAAKWTEFTSATPRDPDHLFEVLATERRQGFTVSDGDVTIGVAAVGAPIRDHTGKTVAGVSVSGLRDYVVGDRAVGVSKRVMEGAAEISRRLGYEPDEV